MSVVFHLKSLGGARSARITDKGLIVCHSPCPRYWKPLRWTGQLVRSASLSEGEGA